MKKRLKVMTYNLRYGFHKYGADKIMLFQENEFRAAQKVIRSEKPDVLGITEAYYGAKQGRLIGIDYAKAFGYRHSYAASYEGDWGSCLLSRFPIVHAERLPLTKSQKGIQMSALRTTIDSKVNIHVDVVHPSPKVQDAARVTAFRPLLKSFQKPYLMIGDFNSPSDEDEYSRADLMKGWKNRAEPPSVMADRFLKRKLIPLVKSYGLHDTLPEGRRTHTLPTNLPGIPASPNMRIDYIFASPEFRTIRSRIIQNKLTDAASDPYPVVAQLELQ